MSDLPPFDPEWLELEKAMGGNREVLTLESAQASREQFRVMFTMMGSGGMQASDAIHEQIVWMTPERFVKIYTPVEAAKKSKSLPVGLYIHCGGFYAGSVGMEDGLCRRIALGSGVRYQPFCFSPLFPDAKLLLIGRLTTSRSFSSRLTIDFARRTSSPQATTMSVMRTSGCTTMQQNMVGIARERLSWAVRAARR